MKNIFNFKITFIFLFLTSLSLTAQQKNEIILYVDTANLTIENMDKTCNFGQAQGVSNEGFTIDVAVGDSVIWRGVSSSNPENDRVEITKIIYSSGTNIFDDRTIKDENGIVTAQVKSGEEGNYEKYDIEFKIYRNGRVVRETFSIDPKLRIISRSSVRR